MPAKSKTVTIDTIYPAPRRREQEPPHNLVVCAGHYFVVTRPGYLWPISVREFEQRRRNAPVVSEYFDGKTLYSHWRKDADA
jgi:hypothetical protein